MILPSRLNAFARARRSVRDFLDAEVASLYQQIGCGQVRGSLTRDSIVKKSWLEIIIEPAQ